MSLVTLGSTTFLVTMGVMLTLWVCSVRKRDASIVDVYWGPGFALIALVTWCLTREHASDRSNLVALLSLVWGVRLGGYLLWRNWGRGEDFRYQAMRRQHGPQFALVSLFTVYGLQGLLLWVISMPLQVAIGFGGSSVMSWLDGVGVLLWVIGFLFESVGDWQLARFKADPANAGRVMDRGLWRYTRHPNYFGDFCVWWSFFLFALASPHGVWTLPSPLIMSVLLMRISGVPMLERTIAQRRPDYERYARRTNAFFPLPPRRM